MSRRFALPMAALLAAAFVYAALRLFGLQFTAGGVYPEYSSLRSDPMGAKLLFDGLAGIPGLRVERNYLPLEYLPAHGAAVLLLGMGTDSLAGDLQVLERTADRGNRVVIALKLPSEGPLPDTKALESAWHVRLDTDAVRGRVHRFYFAESKEWRVLDRIGRRVFAMERDFGKGTVALLAESDNFSNQSTVAGDRLREVSAAIGANSYIVFDERHLGLAEGGSILQMAYRFRMTGLILGLALLTALFLWRNAAGFPPPAAEEGADRLAGRTSQAGLLTLLRRHVPPRDLAAVCWQEWLHSGRGRVNAERLERAAEIARTGAGRPLDAIREIGAVLHTKGEL
jgi:hypothetical protein